MLMISIIAERNTFIAIIYFNIRLIFIKIIFSDPIYMTSTKWAEARLDFRGDNVTFCSEILQDTYLIITIHESLSARLGRAGKLG